MVTLTRPDGTKPWDLHLSRRGLAAALAGGYAVAAYSADAEPIHTDDAGLVTADIQLSSGIPAYVARPAAKGRHPAVIVASEIFGVHEYIRDTCRRFAKAGYVTIAPGFFRRAGDPSTMSDFPAIMAIVAKATDAQVEGDITSALTWLRAQPFVDGKKLVANGFCWGGTAVWETCCRRKDFRAASVFYGKLIGSITPPEADPAGKTPIELVANLNTPVIGFYGAEDRGIPVGDIPPFEAALKAAGKTGCEIIVYPGAQHGFHADYRASYKADAARDAWTRLLAHYAKYGAGPLKA